MRKLYLYIFIFMMTFSISYAQDVYYIQSEQAKVFNKPTFEGQVISVLNKGSRIELLEKAGSWGKLRINNQDGYISFFLLGKTPPLDKTAVKKEDVKETGRKRASNETTAVAGVRGLTEEDRKRLSMEGKVNYEALEKMESVSISREEIKKFLEEGKR